MAVRFFRRTVASAAGLAEGGIKPVSDIVISVPGRPDCGVKDTEGTACGDGFDADGSAGFGAGFGAGPAVGDEAGVDGLATGAEAGIAGGAGAVQPGTAEMSPVPRLHL